MVEWESTLPMTDYNSLNTTYFKGIDVYPISLEFNDNIIPLLKCVAPCYTCLDSDPEYCLSCWGRSTDTGLDQPFETFFLQPSAPEKIGLVENGEIKYPNANK